mgnify:CR=1 FL=1
MSTIKELQQRVGEINAANGWRTTNEAELDDKARVNAQITRLALITTEVAEAIEELRNGHPAGEAYYSGGFDQDPEFPLLPHESHDSNGAPRKPEGVPSELADIVIRALDAAGAWNIDLEAIIQEKLAYNVTRGHRHGGKAV